MEEFYAVLRDLSSEDPFDIYLAVLCEGGSRANSKLDEGEVEHLRNLVARNSLETFKSALRTMAQDNRGGRMPASPVAFEDLQTPWYPALLRLAIELDTGDNPQVMNTMVDARDELQYAMYAVVEEQSDDLLGLNFFPWPKVDDVGRLTFPIDTEPLSIEAPRTVLQDWINSQRAVWADLGLMARELAEIELDYGHTFGVWSGFASEFHSLNSDSLPSKFPSSIGNFHPRREWQSPQAFTERDLTDDGDINPPTRTGRDKRPYTLTSSPLLDQPVFESWAGSGADEVVLFKSDGTGRFGFALDVSWDARQMAKIAHLTASHGTATPTDVERQSRVFQDAAEHRLRIVDHGGIYEAELAGITAPGDDDPEDDFEGDLS
jgi:hypothetical protein